MRNRLLAAAGSAVAGLTLLFSAPTFAATEFGDTCQANELTGGLTVTSASADPLSALPLTAPVSGVITQWKTNIDFPISPLTRERLILLRPASAPEELTSVGVSTGAFVKEGANVFPARIPVQAGDRLALAGNYDTPLCVTNNAADRIFFVELILPAGETETFEEAAPFRVPISAVIEPDADRDGFGDETQDKCPQGAAFQAACPPVTVTSLAVPGKASVSVFVATNLDAPVTVAGTASLGKGRKARLKAAPQTVIPGGLTRFVLKLPNKLKAKLEELTPKQKLTLKITASATNVAGQVSVDTLSAKLKGQG